MEFIIHTDGGARGNPGPAAAGIVIEKKGDDEKKILVREFGSYIGETTNNVAEYTAVQMALTAIKHMPEIRQSGGVTIHFFLDSLLVVSQLNGAYKIKNGHLKELYMNIQILQAEIQLPILYHHIPREQNSRADFYVNKTLDEHTG